LAVSILTDQLQAALEHRWLIEQAKECSWRVEPPTFKLPHHAAGGLASAVDEVAAVGMQHLPGHIRGVVAGQKQETGRDLLGLAGAAHGTSLPKAATCSAGMVAGISGVQIGPGATALTRIPLPTSCWDRLRVKATIAPLVEE
jgi:hypothetical protein